MLQNVRGGVPPNNDAESTPLEKEAEVCLYDECIMGYLEIIVLFINIQVIHHISNVAMDDVLRTIADYMVPQKCNSKMPRIWREAQNAISQVGLDYITIHACPCDEMLFHGDDAERTSYKKCNLSRY